MDRSEQQQNKDVIVRFFRLLEAGDIDAAVGLFADEGTFWSPSTRKTSTRSEFQSALRWVNSKLQAPMTYVAGPMTAEDNRVSILMESHATLINGKKYNNVYNFYFELRDGKILVAREYNDTAHIWATLRADERVG